MPYNKAKDTCARGRGKLVEVDSQEKARFVSQCTLYFFLNVNKNDASSDCQVSKSVFLDRQHVFGREQREKEAGNRANTIDELISVFQSINAFSNWNAKQSSKYRTAKCTFLDRNTTTW